MESGKRLAYFALGYLLARKLLKLAKAEKSLYFPAMPFTTGLKVWLVE
jgi:hypothetical protein